MLSRQMFRLIWAVNGVLILAAGLTLVLQGGREAVLEFDRWLVDRSVTPGVDLPRLVPSWSIGNFNEVAGTDKLAAPLQLGKRYPAYNYLFVCRTTLESHWLLPHREFLIVGREQFGPTGEALGFLYVLVNYQTRTGTVD